MPDHPPTPFAQMPSHPVRPVDLMRSALEIGDGKGTAKQLVSRLLRRDFPGGSAVLDATEALGAVRLEMRRGKYSPTLVAGVEKAGTALSEAAAEMRRDIWDEYAEAAAKINGGPPTPAPASLTTKRGGGTRQRMRREKR